MDERTILPFANELKRYCYVFCDSAESSVEILLGNRERDMRNKCFRDKYTLLLS